MFFHRSLMAVQKALDLKMVIFFWVTYLIVVKYSLGFPCPWNDLPTKWQGKSSAIANSMCLPHWSGMSPIKINSVEILGRVTGGLWIEGDKEQPIIANTMRPFTTLQSVRRLLLTWPTNTNFTPMWHGKVRKELHMTWTVTAVAKKFPQAPLWCVFCDRDG